MQIVSNIEEIKKIELEQKKELEAWQPPPIQRNRISEFEIINQDPSLKYYEWHIRKRNDHYKKILHYIVSNEQSLPNFY